MPLITSKGIADIIQKVSPMKKVYKLNLDFTKINNKAITSLYTSGKFPYLHSIKCNNAYNITSDVFNDTKLNLPSKYFHLTRFLNQSAMDLNEENI